MWRLAVLHAFFKRIGHAARLHFGQLISLLVFIPCMEPSYFSFKLACLLDQSNLLLLCINNSFLKFYDCCVATDSIVYVAIS